MGRIEATAALPFPPDLVWRVATRVADLPRWMPEVVEAELIDSPLAAGSRARLRLSGAVAGAVITATVRQCVAPSLLELSGTGGPLGVVVRVSLRATATGTQASVEVELDTPPLLGFVSGEVERRLRTGLPGALARLQALIEAEPA